MNERKLNQRLIRRFPELLDGYLELKRLWGGDDPGPHIAYGDLLVPIVREALNDGSRREELANQMQFLDELSASSDPYVLDLVVTSVLEPLMDESRRSQLEEMMPARVRQLWMKLIGS